MDTNINDLLALLSQGLDASTPAAPPARKRTRTAASDVVDLTEIGGEDCEKTPPLYPARPFGLDEIQYCRELVYLPDLDYARFIPTKPLSYAQERRLVAYYNTRVNPEHDLLGVTYPITAGDIATLADGVWLNDAVINTYSELCCLRFAFKWRCQVHMCTSFFAAVLRRDNVYAYDAVKGFSARADVDIFSKRALIIPVNIKMTHWVLVFVDFHFKQVVVLDSNHGEYADFQRAVFRYIQDEHMDKQHAELPELASWVTIGGNASLAPKQIGGTDCGVFVCVFCNLLSMFFSRETEPVQFCASAVLSCFSQNDVARMRKQVQLDILDYRVFDAG